MSCLRNEAAPYRAEFDVACRALEKPETHCLLQLFDPGRERRLRDMQRLRCGPKAAEGRHRDKGTHIREIEIHAWIVSIGIFFAIYNEACLADDSSPGAIRSGLRAPTTRDQPIMKISLCGALIAAMALPPLAVAVAAPTALRATWPGTWPIAWGSRSSSTTAAGRAAPSAQTWSPRPSRTGTRCYSPPPVSPRTPPSRSICPMTPSSLSPLSR